MTTLYLDERKFSTAMSVCVLGYLRRKIDTTHTKTVFMHNYAYNLVPKEERPGTRLLLGPQLVGSCGRVWWEGLECCDVSQSCSGSSVRRVGSDWDLVLARDTIGRWSV